LINDDIVEVILDPFPTPSLVTNPISFENDLPITIRKGTCSTHDPFPCHTNLSHHRHSTIQYICLPLLSPIPIPNSPSETLSHLEWQQTMIDVICALESSFLLIYDLMVLVIIKLK